jgi:predicted 2-oxoglutarate/Fe(II)-dependent dioxygenase YbiX|tara:strand:- start:946 stop:1497 length:552 start_codon:yes stop_codon:yes gene_type:complete
MTSEKHLKLLLPYYIKEYRNVISPNLAQRIIEQPDLKFYPATAGGGKSSKARRCYVKSLESLFNEEILEIFNNVFKSYINEFKFFSSVALENSGFDHVLYKGSESQEYKEHVDHSQFNKPRILTCSLILNDNYEGGDLSFFGGEYVITKCAYSAVVFPSNFCFPHAITPVSKKDRHVIITWVR